MDDKKRIEQLETALRDMHRMVHDHVFRSGTPKGFPEGSRTVGPEVLKGINEILREALGRDDPSLKYFSFPDDRAAIEAALKILRAGRRERPLDGPDWFSVRKGGSTIQLDGSFTPEELRALITLLESGSSYETFEPPFASDRGENSGGEKHG